MRTWRAARYWATTTDCSSCWCIKKDRRLLGVHGMGTSATELIHIGQMVMVVNGTVDMLVDNVFNYPTLAEAYKVAAHNAVNKLAQLHTHGA